MAQLVNGSWVLIADGEKALILENHGDEDYPHLQVRRKEEQENPPAGVQAANRPGRFNDGPSVQRSAVEDTDWHELEKERFADSLADLLYKPALSGKFDRLVLVASPMVLGELRKKMHQEVSRRVVAEVPKTLTGHPIDEIETLVKEAVEAED